VGVDAADCDKFALFVEAPFTLAALVFLLDDVLLEAVAA
jgi:hypothetical protein